MSSNPKKVIVFMMNQLGDLLFALPILCGIKGKWLGVKVFVYAKKEHGELLRSSGYVDGIVDKQPIISSVIKIRQEGFDTGVFISESPFSALTGFFSGIKNRLGFETASLSLLYTRTAQRPGVPSMTNNRELGKLLGIDSMPQDYKGIIRLPDDVLKKADQWIYEHKLDTHRMVIIAPGTSSRRKNKAWLMNNWEMLMKKIIDANLFPVLVGSPEETEMLNYMAGALNGEPKVFAPGSLVQVAAMMKRSNLFVGTDSGAMHLAASFGTKVIALFGPTDPAQVGPQPLRENIILKEDSVDKISVDRVMDEIEKAI